MPIKENISNDIIMDLEIPFKVYLLLIMLIVLIIICKYFFSKEEIFEFIEKSKKSSLNEKSKEDKLKLLTQLNTKINRDYLDNSKYYNETGYFKIYGNKKEDIPINTKQRSESNNPTNSIIENKNQVFIKKNKKVCFSDNIIYENEN